MANSPMMMNNANDALEGGQEGAMRAAAVVLGLGPELSRTILQHIDEEDMRSLAMGARLLREQPASAMNKSLRSFVESMGGFGTDMLAGDSLLRDLLSQALGIDAAERAFAEEKPPAPPDEILGPLLDADPEDLALLLSKEKPQTVALILSAMDPTFASEIYGRLPEGERSKIVQKVARVESVSPEVLEDVVHALLIELKSMGTKRGRRRLDGRSAAIEILRRIPAEEQGEAMDSIEENDPDLADELRAKLFTFEDLMNLGDKDVQTLLKEIDVNQLTMALKNASDGVKEKVVANMSGRVAQMLLDDLENMGPVRVSEVEKAQEDLVRVVMDLAEEGRITVVSGNEPML
ncbi:MAG: flagellar motor switch protein FliG [Deltaproteobacteria bacterium]|nr:flagellar motor switch protein FliG [Deltaproteobacteria bacterium]